MYVCVCYVVWVGELGLGVGCAESPHTTYNVSTHISLQDYPWQVGVRFRGWGSGSGGWVGRGKGEIE